MSADRNAPDEFATVSISLRLTAGSEAHRMIELWDVWLMQPKREEKVRVNLDDLNGFTDVEPKRVTVACN